MKNRFYLFLIPVLLVFVCCKNPVKGPDYNSEPQSESEFVTENESESQTQNLQYICFSLNQPRMADMKTLYDYGLQYILKVTDKEGNEVLKSETPEKVPQELYELYYQVQVELSKKEVIALLMEGNQLETEEEALAIIEDWGGWDTYLLLPNFAVPSYEEYSKAFDSAKLPYYSSAEEFFVFLSPGEYNVEILGYTLSDTSKQNVVIKGSTEAVIKEDELNSIAITLTPQSNSQNGGIFYRYEVAKELCKVNSLNIEYISRSVKDANSSATWTRTEVPFVEGYDPNDGFKYDGQAFYILDISDLSAGEYYVKTIMDYNKIETNQVLEEIDGVEVWVSKTSKIPSVFNTIDIVNVHNGFYTFCAPGSYVTGTEKEVKFVYVDFNLNLPPTFETEDQTAVYEEFNIYNTCSYLKLNQSYQYFIPARQSMEITGFAITDSNGDTVPESNYSLSVSSTMVGGDRKAQVNFEVYTLPDSGNYKLTANWQPVS